MTKETIKKIEKNWLFDKIVWCLVFWFTLELVEFLCPWTVPMAVGLALICFCALVANHATPYCKCFIAAVLESTVESIRKFWSNTKKAIG